MIAQPESGGVGQPRLGIDRSVHRIVGLDDPEANVTGGSGDTRSLGLADMEAAAVDDSLATAGEATTARVVRVQLDAAISVEVALTDVADRPRCRGSRRRSILDGQVGDAQILARGQDILHSKLVQMAGRIKVGGEAATRLVVQTTNVLDYLAHVLVPFADGIDSRDAWLVDPRGLRPSTGESLQVIVSQPLRRRRTNVR